MKSLCSLLAVVLVFNLATPDSFPSVESRLIENFGPPTLQRTSPSSSSWRGASSKPESKCLIGHEYSFWFTPPPSLCAPPSISKNYSTCGSPLFQSGFEAIQIPHESLMYPALFYDQDLTQPHYLTTVNVALNDWLSLGPQEKEKHRNITEFVFTSEAPLLLLSNVTNTKRLMDEFVADPDRPANWELLLANFQFATGVGMTCDQQNAYALKTFGIPPSFFPTRPADLCTADNFKRIAGPDVDGVFMKENICDFLTRHYAGQFAGFVSAGPWDWVKHSGSGIGAGWWQYRDEIALCDPSGSMKLKQTMTIR